jgi:putrescine---pyruvate transaminase
MVSLPILDALTSVPYGDGSMHAYTYSGHPTCCAVGLRNLENVEKEGPVDGAAKIGCEAPGRADRFVEPQGGRRGARKGLMGAVELVAEAFLGFGDKGRGWLGPIGA